VGLQRADVAVAAANALPSEVASLDRAAKITWANAAWLVAAQLGSRDLLAGSVVGVDFGSRLREIGTATADAIAAGVAAVIAGERSAFEQEVISADGSRRWMVHARPLGDPSPGVVLMRIEIGRPTPVAPPDPQDPVDLPERIAGLTPRERDVLALMVRGLSNREIAAELGIGYTTVRSHSQAVIEKLAARSRLHAVARAYRAGIVAGPA
jgi:DNA-binding CsgD family transcriptional regulator